MMDITLLYSENVHKLVLFAPLYNYAQHTNLGAGSDYRTNASRMNSTGLGAYRPASEAANSRWNGEI
jgi:hypothetical protein